jgi:O-Antigen ligase
LSRPSPWDEPTPDCRSRRFRREFALLVQALPRSTFAPHHTSTSTRLEPNSSRPHARVAQRGCRFDGAGLESSPVATAQAATSGRDGASEVGFGPRSFGRVAAPRELSALLGLALLGAALGASQLVHAAYDEATWAPIALGALGLVLALAVGVPRRLPIAALAPLLGLWLWSLVSSSWSESSDAAHLAAARWLLYAAALALLCWAVADDRRRGTVLLTGAAAGVVGVAAWMLIRMLTGHGATLFLGTRLNDPLGYVNGQGGYLLAGLWPCLALAERRGPKGTAILAGAGLSGVVLLAALGLLTQSRSWAIALVVTTVVLLVAIPGRRRRGVAVVLVGVVVALLYTPLAHVWRHPNALGVPTAATTHHAAVVIVIATIASGVLWGAVVWALEAFAPKGSRARREVGRVVAGLLAAIVALALVAVAVNASSIAHRISAQYDAFVHLAPTGGGVRFLSGGGDRYDYWRVAMLEFRSEPIRGVGAGNYQPGWYLHRRAYEEIQQPHSLELQTLAELGLVGALLLAAFLVAAGVGFVRTARAAVRSRTARAAAVAGGGVFVGWLIQTSVDWMHLLPGLTGIALAAVAALLARPRASRPPLGTRARVMAAAVAAAIACAGVVTIAPRLLSLHAQTAAEHALAQGRPRVAIIDATRAFDYNPKSVQALVLRAAGFARLHAFAPTLVDIKRALALEPRNWVTWALLGDLLLRRGERKRAHSAYAHALALNPLEWSLERSLAASAPAPKR